MLTRIFIVLPFLVGGLIVAFAAVTLLSPHTLYGMSEATLASSVQGEIGFSGGESRCREHKRGGFSCWVDDPSGGEGPRYVVRTDGGCWKARRPGRPAKRAKLEGCVGLGDYVRLSDVGSS